MLTFVIQKLIHKKWLVICLLIGNVLMVAIACSNPMYMNAALQKMLTRNLSSYLETTNRYPGAVTAAVTCLKGNEESISSELFQNPDLLPEKIKSMISVPLLQEITYRATKIRTFVPDIKRKDDYADKKASVGTLSGLSEHVTVTSGSYYRSEPDEEGIIDCIVSQKALIQMNILLDEVVTVKELYDTDGEALRLRVTGVFEASDLSDVYWATTPSAYGRVFFIDEALFREHVYEVPENEIIYTSQYMLLFDYEQIKTSQVEELLAAGNDIKTEADRMGATTGSVNFTSALENYLANENNVRTTMWILQVPVYILLAAFIFMVSRQMLEMEQNEIAMLKSRGVSKGQIVSVYVVQSTVISAVSMVIGIPGAWLLCRVLGATNTFMEFVGRRALQLQVTGETILYGLLCAAFSILVMTVPALNYAGVTIIEHKQRLRRNGTPLWQKLYLDVILFVLSLYEYYNFSGQTDQIAERIAAGESLDPMIYFCSSLFIFSAGLLALRIFPLITGLVYRIGRKYWRPAAYASFLHILRTRKKQGFISVFLILTIAMGILNAGIARTINKNVEESLSYETGADVVIKEKWDDNSMALSSNPGMKLMYYEPEFSRYEALTEAEQITRVFRDDKTTLYINSREITGIELLAVNTKEFGLTANMKDGVLEEHFYSYLNLMADDSHSILVSQNFADNFGIKVGDTLRYTGNSGGTSTGVVAGFVNAWPTYIGQTTTVGSDGVEQTTERYLIVAHFGQIQSDYGILPYEVWIKVEGSTQFIYDFITEQNIVTSKFQDTRALLVEARNDTVYQVTNGLLTINFMVTLILCAVGFLIYWILSIRLRELLFGVYRAMGMSMKEIIGMLLNEHFFLSFLSIASGTLIGCIATKLFVPLIEIAYRVTAQTLPIEVLIERSDAIRLAAVISGMLLFCIIILGILISKIKIAQALKLGEE